MTNRIKAVLIRAVKTMAQTAFGMITVGATLASVEWYHILSVSAVAGIASIIQNIATGLPETTTQGTLHVDGDTHWAVLDTKASNVKGQTVTLQVNQNASYVDYMNEMTGGTDHVA